MGYRYWCVRLFQIGFVLTIALQSNQFVIHSTAMVSLIACLLVLQLPALRFSARRFAILWQAQWQRVPAERCRMYHVLVGLVLPFTTVIVLALTYPSVWSFTDIGFRQSIWWGWCFCVGVAVAVPFKFGLGKLYRRLPKQNRKLSDRLGAALLFESVPRGSRTRFLDNLETALISPVIEELVYRGFFVFLLSQLIGSVIAGILIGLVVWILLHLYLGPRTIPSIVAFYVVSVMLLFSPLGLVGAIGFHVACNIHYLIHRFDRCLWYIYRYRSRLGVGLASSIEIGKAVQK